MEDLNINQKSNIKNQNDNLKLKNVTDENQLLVIKIIQKSGGLLSIDEIIKMTKLEPHIASQVIAFLTIAGIIKETENKYTL